MFGDCSPPGIGERRIEEAALRIEVEDPRSELVADPQVTVPAALHRLGVDVGTGQESIGGRLVHDREADPVVRIAELDELADLHGPGPALRGLEVGTEVVGADEEVGGCRLGAVAVVGHGQDLTGPAAVDDRREALDRL